MKRTNALCIEMREDRQSEWEVPLWSSYNTLNLVDEVRDFHEVLYSPNTRQLLPYDLRGYREAGDALDTARRFSNDYSKDYPYTVTVALEANIPDGKTWLDMTGESAPVPRVQRRYTQFRVGFVDELVGVIDWQEREALRLRYGMVLPVVWADEDWFLDNPAAVATHPHIDPDDPNLVCFYEDDEKAKARRVSKIKPGKFLERYFGDVLDQQIIGDWAAKHGSEYGESELLFASTPDDIAEVYMNGPRSCMGYGMGSYAEGLPCHPTAVYGAGDLAVAYIKRGGRITARAMVWPDRKVYSVIYGDSERLRPKLRDLGYYEGDLEGARMLRITHPDDPDALVVPYIDGVGAARDEDDHLVIDCCGAIDCEVTGGLTRYRSRPACDECGSRDYDHDECVTSADGEHLCPDCFFYCGLSDDYYNAETHTRVDYYPSIHTLYPYMACAAVIAEDDAFAIPEGRDEYYPTADLIEHPEGGLYHPHDYDPEDDDKSLTAVAA